jgi:hypothetical protein
MISLKLCWEMLEQGLKIVQNYFKNLLNSSFTIILPLKEM